MKFTSSLKKSQTGFTTIELLVVFIIIAILALAALIIIDPVKLMRRSRDSRRIQDLEGMYKALEHYASQNNEFPESALCESSVGSCAQACPCPISSDNWNQTNELWQALVGGGHLPKLPVDPTNNSEHHYRYQSNCGDALCGDENCCAYYLGCNLEDDDQSFVWLYTP